MQLKEILPPNKFDQVVFIFTYLCILFTPVSIAISQSFLALAFLSWVLQSLHARRIDISAPPIMLPLLAFMLTTLVACLFSPDVLESIRATRKFVLFFIILLVFNKFRRFDQIHALYKGLFVVAGASSILGLAQYRPDDPLHRIKGFMGHWMTFSGLEMLLFAALFAFVVCAPRRALWTLPILLVTGGAILLSLTRSVWIAVLCSSTLTLLIRRSKFVLIVPVLMLAIFFLAPFKIVDRAKSIFRFQDATVKTRLTMFPIAKRMVAQHPFVGIGPNLVPRYVIQYGGDPSASPGSYIHLHNNFFQLAAERGLPCLLAWVWLIVKLFYEYYKMAKPLSLKDVEFYPLLAGISGLSSFLIAGLFEYNFGDSEVAMLLFFVITAPYVIYRQIGTGQSLENA